jgi:hypothetical protein
MRSGGPTLLLEEISNADSPWFDFEMTYDLSRFRPLVTTNAEAEDLALFRDLLTQKSKVDA